MSERQRRADQGQSPEIIRSSANPLVKYIRSLGRRNQRRQERAFVVEGVRVVQAALAVRISPLHTLFRGGFVADADVSVNVHTRGPRRVLAAALFDALPDPVHPRGVFAVLPFPDLPLSDPRSPLYSVV